MSDVPRAQRINFLINWLRASYLERNEHFTVAISQHSKLQSFREPDVMRVDTKLRRPRICLDCSSLLFVSIIAASFSTTKEESG